MQVQVVSRPEKQFPVHQRDDEIITFMVPIDDNGVPGLSG